MSTVLSNPIASEVRWSPHWTEHKSAHVVPIDTHQLVPTVSAAPTMMVELIVERLKALPHVRRILLGQIGSVYHVWTITDRWTSQSRREIYAVQMNLLETLRGSEIESYADLDFYIVGSERGDNLDDFVAGLPVIFSRD